MDRLIAYPYWVPITIWEKLHMDQFKYIHNNKHYEPGILIISVEASSGTSSPGFDFTFNFDTIVGPENLNMNITSVSSRTIILDFTRICSTAREAEILNLALARVTIAMHGKLAMVVKRLNIDGYSTTADGGATSARNEHERERKIKPWVS
ncbi:hypothetical protein GT037_009906, partial [Alternaria burnsii]